MGALFVYFRNGLRSQGLADPPQLVVEDQPVVSVMSELHRSKVLGEKRGTGQGAVTGAIHNAGVCLAVPFIDPG